MTKTQFDRLLKALSDPKTNILDADKIKALPLEEKAKCVNYLLKKRWPILSLFLEGYEHMEWVRSCGYNRIIKGNIFDFHCTCENENQILKTTHGNK